MGTLNELMDNLEDAKVRIEKLENALKWIIPKFPIESEADSLKIGEFQALLKEGTPIKVKITDIDYDLDEDDSDEGLPKELEMELPRDIDRERIEDLASDFISERTGFCHNGFSFAVED